MWERACWDSWPSLIAFGEPVSIYVKERWECPRQESVSHENHPLYSGQREYGTRENQWIGDGEKKKTDFLSRTVLDSVYSCVRWWEMYRLREIENDDAMMTGVLTEPFPSLSPLLSLFSLLSLLPLLSILVNLKSQASEMKTRFFILSDSKNDAEKETNLYSLLCSFSVQVDWFLHSYLSALSCEKNRRRQRLSIKHHHRHREKKMKRAFFPFVFLDRKVLCSANSCSFSFLPIQHTDRKCFLNYPVFSSNASLFKIFFA